MRKQRKKWRIGRKTNMTMIALLSKSPQELVTVITPHGFLESVWLEGVLGGSST